MNLFSINFSKKQQMPAPDWVPAYWVWMKGLARLQAERWRRKTVTLDCFLTRALQIPSPQNTNKKPAPDWIPAYLVRMKGLEPP